METQWFISVVLHSYLHAYTGASFDVLIGCELDTADHVSDLEIGHANSCLRADEVLQFFDGNELAVDLDEVGFGVAADIEENAHGYLQSIIKKMGRVKWHRGRSIKCKKVEKDSYET